MIRKLPSERYRLYYQAADMVLAHQARGLRAALAARDEHDFAAADFSDRHG